MTVDRLQNKSRQLLRTTLGSLILVSGCTTPGMHTDCSPACSTGECLPRTQLDAPPAAMIAKVDRCVEPIDPAVIQAPNGTYLNHWRELMSRGAQQTPWVIERNEWFDGGEQLGPKGSDHLARIAAAFSEDPQWIAIENAHLSLNTSETYEDATARTEKLDQSRRSEVIRLLTDFGIAKAEPWVVMVEDRTVGVRGIEAPNVYNTQFSGGQGTGNQGSIGQGTGQNGGFGSGFGSGLGGGGFGGGLNSGGIF